ncbi:WRKY Transcription Factor, variant 2 [Sarracenia purpurea var. burkii]
MGGFDDHVAVIEDWVPPSPSPRAFFSAGWGDDDSSSRSISNHPAENRNGAFFPGRDEQIVSGKTDEKDWERIGGAGDQFTKSNPFLEQEMSSRGGLFERRAARTGFNAPRLNTESIRPADLSLNPDVRSPYLTIPPGLSPTTLLESPVFLSNLPVQPSPTTGKFSFAPGGNTRSSTLITEPLKGSKNFPEDINASSFTFKPVAASDPSLFSGAASKRTPSTLPQQTFPTFDVSVQSENSLQSQSALPAKILSQNGATLHCQADFSIPSDEKDAGGSNTVMSDSRVFGNFVGSADRSPPPDEQQDEETDQRGVGDTTVGGAQAEDGYNWRKYGQKQVKGSEYPRSYYKCTHPNCPVKKKVERSPEGHVTEIIYKGAHNHPKPPLNRRSVMGYPNLTTDIQVEISDQTGTQIGADDEPSWTTVQKGTADCNGPNYLQGKNGTHGELGDAIDVSSTFSNEEEEDDQGTYGSESLGYDGNGYESDSKRRKMECYATEMGGATRAIREPRVVVQTTSDVDILDDGYRWRKYGQKVVKGNPNPRLFHLV